MSNTKTTILDALIVKLEASAQVGKATRVLMAPAEARKWSPYVGLIAGQKRKIVQDPTQIRFELPIDLILLKKGREIEEMLDGVKNVLYSGALANDIGALQVRIIGQEEVAILDADKWSSTRIIAIITYVVTKSAF